MQIGRCNTIIEFVTSKGGVVLAIGMLDVLQANNINKSTPCRYLEKVIKALLDRYLWANSHFDE